MNKKPKLLDLFCGAGGASMGYYRAGFEVEGVDIKPQPHYPFRFYQANALEFPLDGYDAYHASPPCQRFSAMQHIHNNRNEHPDLITPARELFLATTKLFVIENVVGSPLHISIMLCGTMFGLRIPKHRIFEANFDLPILTLACNHADVYDPYHGGEMARGEREKLSKVIGIDWFMTRPEVREAIPPAYTEYIGQYLLRAILNN